MCGFISKYVDRKKLAIFWILSNVIIQLLFLFYHPMYIVHFYCALIGFTYGLGFPICFSLFGDKTHIIERGRIASILITILYVFLPIIIIITDSIITNFFQNIYN